jgi:proton-coupled amino acid transporter
VSGGFFAWFSLKKFGAPQPFISIMSWSPIANALTEEGQGVHHDGLDSILGISMGEEQGTNKLYTEDEQFVHDDEEQGLIDNQLVGDEHGATALQGFFSIAKASIGAGSFALPFAFSQSGIILGSLGLCLISALSLYTMRLMVETKKLVNQHIGHVVSYDDVADKLFPRGGRLSVQISVIFTSIGILAGYLLFIGLNFRASLLHLFGVQWNLLEVYCLILPLIILLSFLPSYRALSYAAYVGTVFMVFALVFSIVDAALHANLEPINDYGMWRMETFPTFFGIAVFLFGVHIMVIPMESGLKDPARIGCVLTSGCIAVLAANLPFAVFGYLAFGDGVDSLLFCNLPKNVLLYFIQFFLSIELMFTVPLALLPSHMIVEKWMNVPESCQTLQDSFKQKCIRIALVLTGWALAIFVPVFSTILSLVGGFSCTAICFIIPSILHAQVLKEVNGDGYKKMKKFWVSVLIAILGFIALVVTTEQNIQSIVQTLSQGVVQRVYEHAPENGSC